MNTTNLKAGCSSPANKLSKELLVKKSISSEAAKNYGDKSKVKLYLVFENLLLIIHILHY